MKRFFWQWMGLLSAGILLLTGCQASLSDHVAFPERQITYMIPFEAGGQSDVEARRQHPLLEKSWPTRHHHLQTRWGRLGGMGGIGPTKSGWL